MCKFFRCCIFAFIFIIPSTIQAKQSLKVGVGNFPPFFVQEGQSGIFIDITKAIFANLPEYEVTFLFMSNSRLLHEINSSKRIDVACNIFKNSAVEAYLSEPIFRYTDVAITKKAKNITLNSVSDLHKVSISAYQGAMDLLGEDFKKVAQSNSNYSEHPHPKQTTHLLIADLKDVRIGDINIFYHDLNNKRYQNSEHANIDNYKVHYLWPDVFTHMAFKNKDLRDAVNVEIKKLSLDGTFTKIYQKYKIQ
jgi:ABC-type amino acid transport substrate-binding protein